MLYIDNDYAITHRSLFSFGFDLLVMHFGMKQWEINNYLSPVTIYKITFFILYYSTPVNLLIKTTIIL